MSPPSDESGWGLLPEGRFLLGLSLALLNCALSSLGFTLQRYAQLLSEGSANDSPLWAKERMFLFVGRLLYITAALPDVLAYTLVPQVVCTTVACFRLVVVTFLAHSVLRERVAGREALGMVACSVGTFFCLYYGPRQPGEDSPEGAPGELYHPQVKFYIIVGSIVLVALLLADHSSYFPKSKDFRSVSLPLATGLAFALQKVFNTEIGFLARHNGMEDFFDNPGYIAMCLGVGVLGIMDFYLNSRGAQALPVQVFVPVSFALCTSLQLFQSIVVFQEFSEMDALSVTQTSCGAITSLVGAMLIKPPKLSVHRQELLEDFTAALPPLPADLSLQAIVETAATATSALVLTPAEADLEDPVTPAPPVPTPEATAALEEPQIL